MIFKNSKPGQKISLDASFLMVIKITGTILLMLLAMRFFEKIADIILLSLASVFLAVALNPAVIKIRRSLGIKRRGLAISLAFGLIVVAMITIFMVTVPPVFNQISDFAEDLPQKVEDFRKELPEVFSDVASESEPEPDSGVVAQSESEPEPEPGLVNRIADYFKSDINGLVDVLRGVSSAFGAVLIVLFMTFMLLLEGPGFISQMKHYLNKQQSKKFETLKNEMNTVIRGYITGQFLIALIGGLFSLLLMIIIGVPNPLAMASVITLFALIPLIGALIGASIVVLLTGLVSIKLALILLVWFVVYQQVENVTLQPWIQGQQTNLTALQVFVVALLGGTVAGIGGVLLAVPIAACIKIVLIDYLTSHKEEIKRKYLKRDAVN